MFDLTGRTYGVNGRASGICLAISAGLADLPDRNGEPVAERLGATVLFTLGVSTLDGMDKNVGAFGDPVNDGYHQ